MLLFKKTRSICVHFLDIYPRQLLSRMDRINSLERMRVICVPARLFITGYHFYRDLRQLFRDMIKALLSD